MSFFGARKIAPAEVRGNHRDRDREEIGVEHRGDTFASIEHDVRRKHQGREQEDERSGLPRDQARDKRGRIAPRNNHQHHSEERQVGGGVDLRGDRAGDATVIDAEHPQHAGRDGKQQKNEDKKQPGDDRMRELPGGARRCLPAAPRSHSSIMRGHRHGAKRRLPSRSGRCRVSCAH